MHFTEDFWAMLIRVGEINIVNNQCERTIYLPFGVRTGTGPAPAKQVKDCVSQSTNSILGGADIFKLF